MSQKLKRTRGSDNIFADLLEEEIVPLIALAGAAGELGRWRGPVACCCPKGDNCCQ